MSIHIFLHGRHEVPTLILNCRPIPPELMLQEDGQSNAVVSAQMELMLPSEGGRAKHSRTHVQTFTTFSG